MKWSETQYLKASLESRNQKLADKKQCSDAWEKIDELLETPSWRAVPIEVKLKRFTSLAPVLYLGATAETIGDIVDHPDSWHARIALALGTLGIAGVIAWIRARPFVEIRRINRSLPGSSQLESDIVKIF